MKSLFRQFHHDYVVSNRHFCLSELSFAKNSVTSFSYFAKFLVLTGFFLFLNFLAEAFQYSSFVPLLRSLLFQSQSYQFSYHPVEVPAKFFFRLFYLFDWRLYLSERESLYCKLQDRYLRYFDQYRRNRIYLANHAIVFSLVFLFEIIFLFPLVFFHVFFLRFLLLFFSFFKPLLEFYQRYFSLEEQLHLLLPPKTTPLLFCQPLSCQRLFLIVSHFLTVFYLRSNTLFFHDHVSFVFHGKPAFTKNVHSYGKYSRK